MKENRESHIIELGYNSRRGLRETHFIFLTLGRRGVIQETVKKTLKVQSWFSYIGKPMESRSFFSIPLSASVRRNRLRLSLKHVIHLKLSILVFMVPCYGQTNNIMAHKKQAALKVQCFSHSFRLETVLLKPAPALRLTLVVLVARISFTSNSLKPVVCPSVRPQESPRKKGGWTF